MVYIRRPSAETAPVSTPQDWDDLISRCVRVRRDEFLTEFRELLGRMTSPSLPSPSAEAELLSWMERMRSRALEGTEEGGGA